LEPELVTRLVNGKEIWLGFFHAPGEAGNAHGKPLMNAYQRAEGKEQRAKSKRQKDGRAEI
jgi:hypothetical protein